MNGSPAAAAGLVKTCAATLDAELPDRFLASLDAAAALIVAAEGIGDGGPQLLHDAVLDCLQRGGDLHADKAVARALFDLQLANVGVGGAARGRADSLIVAALVEFSDEILAGWSSTLQPALTQLSAAAAVLPYADLNVDSAAIIARGGDALHHWASATESLRLAKAATDAAAIIATAAGITLTRQQRPLLTTPADLDAFNDIITTTGSHVSLWSAARHGLPLHLIGSLGELIERLADLDQQRQAAIDAEAERQKRPRAAART